jgi:uncharacterized Tic20 family protein
MRKGIFALIGMILALVFIIVALVGPWYGVGLKYPESAGGQTETLDFTLTRAKGTMLGIPVDEGYDSPSMDETAKNVFNYSMYITIFTLIIGILALIGVLGYVFGFGKPDTMKKLGWIFGILTFVLALVAVLYFMTALPVKTLAGGATDVGFWYSKSQAGATISMGPGYGWYLMLVTAIIALITSIMLLIFKEKQVLPTQQMP